MYAAPGLEYIRTSRAFRFHDYARQSDSPESAFNLARDKRGTEKRTRCIHLTFRDCSCSCYRYAFPGI